MTNFYTTNFIHETAIVDDSTLIGKGNYIGPFCVIHPNVNIGDNNRFESHVSIGSPAEKHGFFRGSYPQTTIIGNNNIIREFVTINAGTRRSTVMHDACVMLRGSHLSHDSVLEDECNISCCVMIGGESHIMTGANLGLGALLHQFSVIGSYSMIGMGAVCTKKTLVKPGSIFVGSPAKFLKENTVGLSRNNISKQELDQEEARWELLRDTNQ